MATVVLGDGARVPSLLTGVIDPTCVRASVRAGGRTRVRARVPQQDTTPTASTASLPVLARRFRADLHGIRLFEGLEPDSWESRPAPLVDVDGLDRESSAGGRGRPRPRVLSW